MRWIAALVALLVAATASAVPPGFVLEPVGSGWNEAVGMAFAADGRMFVWERGGRIWAVDENGVKSAQPVLDIHDEIGAWQDYGMLGVALHPNFLNNRYVYLFYVVDRHHLLYAGTPGYDPEEDEYYEATIGRLTRYTLNPDFASTDYSSRLVLIGDTAQTGVPILSQTHGTGALVFGTDGTLLVTIGDGASPNSTDIGSAPESHYIQALADGIIEPKENVGSFRSQLLDSLNGKILRIDPDTGAGVPTNPFYDPAQPGGIPSRVWALGTRNPYRMIKVPGTGSHEEIDGDPGVFIFGDVGWNRWEDVHVVDGPGLNFGWPNFEGNTIRDDNYHGSNAPNQDAPNPLYGQSIPGIGLCSLQFFTFSHLIIDATLDPDPSFPNPCDPAQQIPDTWTDGASQTWTYHKWVHRRPEIDYRHGTGPSRWSSFSGNDPVVTNIGPTTDPNGKSVPGPQFGGNTSTAGAWYTTGNYPAEWHNSYFHGDYGSQWIRNVRFDANYDPVDVRDFHLGAGGVVHIARHPLSGELYYIQWAANVLRIRWVGTGPQPPVAVASQDLQYGASPLTVQFTGEDSSDPNDDPLSYDWDFGDGSPHSSAPNPTHTFTAPGGVPTSYTVTLTVSDASAQDTATLLVSVNNTPPSVSITSPSDGHLFAMEGTGEQFPLAATISDAEQASGWTCRWERALFHNEHSHSEPAITSCTTSQQIVFTPIGCDGNLYFYRVLLRVTDPLGLVAEDVVDTYPDCSNVAPNAQPDTASVARAYSVIIDVLANDSDPDGAIDPASVEVEVDPASGSTSVNPATGAITYTHDGSPATSDSFSYSVADTEGLRSAPATVSITAFNTPPTVTLVAPLDHATYTVGQSIPLQANASDAEDGPSVTRQWAIHRLHNGQLVQNVFTHTEPSPPSFVVPDVGVAGDRISYLVEVRAVDLAGAIAVDRAHVIPASPPANVGPVASFVGSPSVGAAPLEVFVDATGSSDPDGDYLLYEWDFGDGATGFGVSASHVYTALNAYTVTLTVSDAAGAQSTATFGVNVLSPGMVGTYYDTATFTNLKLTRSDPMIDFDWGSGSPHGTIGASTFSVRWTGQIEPSFTQTYTIYAVHDDGMRVWVDGQLVVDEWANQTSPVESSGTIDLVAGQRYDLLIEYYENTGNAVARLLWSSASQPKQVVPDTQLFPPPPPNLPPFAVDDQAGALAGLPAQVAVLANDLDDRDEIDPTSVIAGNGSHGNTTVDPSTGIVTYHNDGTAGSDSFTYTVADLDGARSNPATVAVNVLEASAISITSPTEGQLVTGPNVVVSYQLSGDPSLYNHIHWQVDGGPISAQYAPYGSYAMTDLSPGPHTVHAELVNGDSEPLGFPNSSDTVSFQVQASAPPVPVLPPLAWPLLLAAIAAVGARAQRRR